MTTKTQTLRRSKDVTLRIIATTEGSKFLLIQKDKLVRIRDRFFTVTPTVTKYVTHHSHSLPWSILRRILKTPGEGRIRNGWYYNNTGTSLLVGCQKFDGANYTALVEWAKGY